MSVQLIVQNGQPEWAVLPYDDYLQLVELAEMLEDIQDFDKIHSAVENGNEELLPADVVFALAKGENPLKIWREYRGMTQQQLAETAQISIPFLSQIETGKRKASINVLSNIASILRVDVDDLINK
jgi:DNA-binding XRE family transcriptional regulator